MAIQPFSYDRKKKILVLVSRGGGGHKSAGEAIQQVLGSSYDIEINYVFEDILKKIDTLNIITQGRYTGEDLYNFFLKHHQKHLLHWMVELGKKVMSPRRVKKAFDCYLSELPCKPDLIISPTPWINYGAASSAHQFDIPFLIIPTDLDGSTFLIDFPDHETPLNFKLALAYDDEHLLQTTIQNKQIREDQIIITGFPVKPACSRHYSTQEKQRLKTEFHLLEGYQTLTLVMGAVGGNLILNHVKSLLTLDPRPHDLLLQMNVCTGTNEKAARQIKELLRLYGARPLAPSTYILPTGMILHIHGYLSNLIDLMAVSDLILTKTGSCTVNEAIYLQKQLLLDNTDRATARFLAWEKFNVPFVEKYGLGLSFTDSRQLPMLVPSLLKYPEKSKTTLERPPFEENLRSLIDSILHK